MNTIPIWMPNSPLNCCAGDTFPVTDTIPGGTTISAVTTKIYLGTVDKTATNMPSGSATNSGNVYTTKPITLLLGGNTYILTSNVTVDGIVTTRKCEIRVQKDSDLA